MTWKTITPYTTCKHWSPPTLCKPFPTPCASAHNHDNTEQTQQGPEPQWQEALLQAYETPRYHAPRGGLQPYPPVPRHTSSRWILPDSYVQPILMMVDGGIHTVSPTVAGLQECNVYQHHTTAQAHSPHPLLRQCRYHASIRSDPP